MATPAPFRANQWTSPPHRAADRRRTSAVRIWPGCAVLLALTCASAPNGLLEGPQQQWYASGQLREERFYHDNRKVGRHRGWWPNGNPRFDYTIQNDIPIGTHRDWFENGQLAALFTYAPNGQPEGRQTMWFANGQLRANYVVRHGRRYGLFGTKGCGGSMTDKR